MSTVEGVPTIRVGRCLLSDVIGSGLFGMPETRQLSPRDLDVAYFEVLLARLRAKGLPDAADLPDEAYLLPEPEPSED